MSEETRKAADLVEAVNDVTEINKDRTSWMLKEWNSYFEDPDNKHILTAEEIASAALWLVDHGYPIPTDCPKRPEEAFRDGGCPAFRPICLMSNICRAARGMCDSIADVAYCPTCKKKFSTNAFRDPLSKKEFEISGMCQECQDKTFGR